METIHEKLAIPGAELTVSEYCLKIDFANDHPSLSTAIYGGGFRNVRSVLNQRLTKYFASEADFPGGSVEGYLKECAKEAGADLEKCSVLLTAAKVYLYSQQVLSHDDLLVEIITTGGVEKTACRASSVPMYREQGGKFFPVGTINMMVCIHGQLPPGIMARALITLTEGKTAALQDLGIADVNNGLPATGTGTDGITLVTSYEGPQYTDAGPFSELGAFLAQAAYRSVAECLMKYDHPWNAFPELKTPKAVDIKAVRSEGAAHKI